MSVGEMTVSPDGNLLAYTDRRHRLPPVHAAREGPAHGPARAGGRSRASPSVEWAEDGKTLFYSRRAPADQARPTRSSATPLGARQGRPRLRGEGRALQRRRLEVARPQVPLRGERAASPRPRSATSPPTSRPAEMKVIAAREPDHEYDVDHRDGDVLDPHQRQGPQLPAGHGAGRRSRAGELEGGRAAPRRRDAVAAHRPLPGLLRAGRARGRLAAPPRHRLPQRPVAPHRRSRSPPTWSRPANNREFDAARLPPHLPVAHHLALRSTTTTRRPASARCSSRRRCSADTTRRATRSRPRRPRAPDGVKVPMWLRLPQGPQSATAATRRCSTPTAPTARRCPPASAPTSSASSTAAWSTPWPTSAAAASSARSGTTRAAC